MSDSTQYQIDGKAPGALPLLSAEQRHALLAATVAPGAHAVLLLDQAGWHGSDALIVPPNITLMPLPSKCPGGGSRRNDGRPHRDAPALDESSYDLR